MLYTVTFNGAAIFSFSMIVIVYTATVGWLFWCQGFEHRGRLERKNR